MNHLAPSRSCVRRAALALCAAILTALPAWGSGEASLVPSGAQANWPRLGLNLGHRTAWGAEQLVANVLRNPGLEPGLDGALVVVGATAGGLVADDSAWLNRREGFWAGARFSVLSGAAAGAEGRVRDSHPGPGARPGPTRFLLEPNPPGVQAGDVIAVQGQQDAGPVPLWWTHGLVKSLRGQGRPGSPGTQSVSLAATSVSEASLVHHLDGITARAGKLLPVQGPWVFSIWSRSSSRSATLQVRFRRHGTVPWLEHQWSPGEQWQERRLAFDARDAGPDGPLELVITARHGAVEVDDLYLGEANPGAGGFRQATVAALKVLKPGYLREWQGQLGDSVANRLAPAYARQPSRYRTGTNDWFFHYSVAEFSELAAALGARPWYVLPAATSPEQARAFGQALREMAQKHAFDEMVVEYGNEHWNTMFRAAGIADATRLAEAAAGLFRALREGAGPQTPLHLVLGAQFVRPETARALSGGAAGLHGVAVAPYFAYRMTRAQSVDELVRAAVNEGDEHFKAWREQLPAATDLSVYEVNAHTTLGDGPAEMRAQWANSPGVGVALARRLLQASAHGVRRQAVYTLSGHDTPVDGVGAGLVPLFGVTQALGAPVRLRQTGETLAALNALDWGRSAPALCTGAACPRLTARFFGAASQLAVVSSESSPTALSWPCPKGAPPRWRVRWLGSQTQPARWQEDRVVCSDGQARWSVPALALAIFQQG